MTFTSTSLVVSLFTVAACVAAAPTRPDPSAKFAAIDRSITGKDYYQADFILGSLSNDLLAAGVAPVIGDAHRHAMDSGHANSDLVGLIREARVAWSQAMRGEQPWDGVMVRLLVASSSAVVLDSQLPPSLRYEQALARYRAAPSNILLQQLTLRAFEAGEREATLRYVNQLRVEILEVFQLEGAAPIVNRLDTIEGLVKLDMGDLAGAIQALADSASALQQARPATRLREAPRMLLARRLLQAGQSAPVLAYLEVCAQFKYPGGDEYTDEGRNLHSPSQMIAAIRAGVEPQFGNLDLY
jgi:hypothetical protein